MKISVIIPAFNAELYIEECIQSVLDDDYHDLEVIIINDGSTDRTGDIINSFKEPFIHKIHTKNKGLSAARNTGIEKSTGDFILFLDSDDKLNKRALLRLNEIISESSPDIVFFESETIFEDRSLSERFNPKYERNSELTLNKLSGVEFFKLAVKGNNYIVNACLYILRKAAIPNTLFKDGILHEDNLFTTYMLLDNDVSVSCVKEKLHYRRVRHGSLMTQLKTNKHLDGYYACVHELINNPPKNHSLALSEYNTFTTHMLDCFKYTNLDIAEQQKHDLIKMQNQYEREIEHVKDAITALKQSSSWRITAPLRKIKDIFKK